MYGFSIKFWVLGRGSENRPFLSPILRPSVTTNVQNSRLFGQRAAQKVLKMTKIGIFEVVASAVSKFIKHTKLDDFWTNGAQKVVKIGEKYVKLALFGELGFGEARSLRRTNLGRFGTRGGQKVAKMV